MIFILALIVCLSPQVGLAIESPEQAVTVSKVTQDDRIQKRLNSILSASGWFSDFTVVVDSGIVILEGHATNLEHAKWAEEVTKRTEGVIAVVNKLQPEALDFFDLSPAREQMELIGKRIVRNLPFIVLAAVVLGLTFFLTSLSAKIFRRLFRNKFGSDILLMTISRLLAIPIFLVGLYTVLQIGGLTKFAVTLIGGTGLIGLVLGLAFKGILENFLASLILSVRQPFRVGDIVEVLGHEGVIDSVTTRATVLIDYDGNHILIPNSLVFNSIVKNQTANPNMRVKFAVGIAQDESVEKAQKIILAILRKHSEVSTEMESTVIVDGMGASTMNLVVYFWVNIRRHSWRKVRSFLITEVKEGLLSAGVSIPDEARELIFPEGIRVSMVREKATLTATRETSLSKPSSLEAASPNRNLESEQKDLKKIARDSVLPDQGANIVHD